MARVFAVMAQILLSITRVVVQVLSNPRTYHPLQNSLRALAQCRAEGPDRSAASVRGTGFKLRADARFAHRSGAKVGVRVQELLQICLRCRSKAKTVTNNLPILSVLAQVMD